MMRLIQIELYKLFCSPRTYLTFALGFCLMLVINLGLYSDGEELFEYLLQAVNEYFYVEGTIVNGYLISYLALNMLWVHIPILIVIVTSHIFASEFELGTIRLMLTQPISRGKFLLAKMVSMVFYVVCFMTIIGLSALAPAVIIFGVGDVVVFIDGIQFIQEPTYLKRYLQTILFATVAMVAFSSMAMFFAMWFKNTLTAILISIGILILLTLLQTFVFGFFSSWQPFLFTYHTSKWQLFFVSEIPYDSIFNSVYFLIGMSFLFGLLTYLKFNKMNISE